MKSKALKRALSVIFSLLFWLLLWQALAIKISNNFLLPTIPSTIEALCSLLSTEGFYTAVLFSLLRVIAGLILGCILGIALGVISKKLPIINALISPMITVIRSTPVASFIVMLWVLLSGDELSIFIAFLMVMPIVWQSTCDGFDATDKGLSEVAQVFEFSFGKRLGLLILPTLKQYLVPAIITATGLAWKAEIAAEIIGYTKKSIGQGINDAKQVLDTPTVFAWTVVIILFSIVLEKSTKYLLGRFKK